LLRWVRWNCEDSSSNICLVVWNMTFISIIYGIYSQPCRDIWWNIWYIYTDWWFGTWLLFSVYWECHHPNWRTPWFFK
jgi:hypothetical protein